MAFSSAAPSWLVLLLARLTMSPSSEKLKSSTLRAASSERRKAPVKPSSSTTRSRRPATVLASMLFTVRLNSASENAGACFWRMPLSRAMPSNSTLNFLSSVGESTPRNAWALLTAAQWRWMVATFLPVSAKWVTKPARVSTEAGNGSSPCSAHQAPKRFRSPA